MATNTPARTPAKKKKAPASDDDIRDVSYDDDEGTFTARVLDEDEPFRFSTDVNWYVAGEVFSGGMESIGAMRKLIQSLVMIPADAEAEAGGDPDKLDGARFMEKRRFDDMMARQSNMSIERLSRFLGKLFELAGKETGD